MQHALRRMFLSAVLVGVPVTADAGGSGDGGDAQPRSRKETMTVDLKTRKAQGDASGAGVAVEADPGGLMVKGTLRTPNPCVDVSAAVERKNSVVTLTIRAGPKGQGMCVAVIGHFVYEARINGVPPGRYTLRVLHAYPRTGWATATALEKDVNLR